MGYMSEDAGVSLKEMKSGTKEGRYFLSSGCFFHYRWGEKRKNWTGKLKRGNHNTRTALG